VRSGQGEVGSDRVKVTLSQCPLMSRKVRSGLARPGNVNSGQHRLGQDRSGSLYVKIRSCVVRSGYVMPGQVRTRSSQMKLYEGYIRSGHVRLGHFKTWLDQIKVRCAQVMVWTG